jgi:hypothetical protein
VNDTLSKFQTGSAVIIRHTDGRGQPLTLQGTIADPASISRPVVKGAQWVNVGGVALLVDEELIDAKQISKAEEVHVGSGAQSEVRQEGGNTDSSGQGVS